MKNFISLLLDTNDNGNTVFLKERKGNEYIYLAAEHTSNGSSHLRRMTKEEVIANKDFLTNVGVSGDKIYPITELRYRKRLPEGMVKCDACGEVIWENDSYSFHKYETNDDITICRKCEKYGHDGYVSCRGCSTYQCWVETTKVHETASSGYSDSENLVCDEFLENYSYCEDCEVYYHQDYSECPRCGK